jgi:hypothetical protein
MKIAAKKTQKGTRNQKNNLPLCLRAFVANFYCFGLAGCEQAKKSFNRTLNQLLYGVKYIDNGGQNGQKN